MRTRLEQPAGSSRFQFWIGTGLLNKLAFVASKGLNSMAIVNFLKRHLSADFRDRLRITYYLPRRILLSLLYRCNLLKAVCRNIKGIHLGCGMSRIKTFINIDGSYKSNCDLVGRIERLAFASDSVDVIYCSHSLEHVSHRRCAEVLSEWFRLLKPGGHLFIAVPDIEILFTMYLNALDEYSSPATRAFVDDLIKIIFGGQSYPLNQHRNGFSFTTLNKWLLETGFTNIERWDSNVKVDFEMPADASSTTRGGTLISLNIKAQKPA